jgi:hypothetical protein
MMLKGAVMVIPRALVLVLPPASVTLKVTVEVPALVGVPDITPVEVFNVNPAGNVPVVVDHT